MALADWLAQADLLTDIITERLVVPLTIIFTGIILGKITGNLLTRLGEAVKLDTHGKLVFGERLELTELLARGTTAVIYTIATVWALVRAGIAREAALVLFGALAMLAMLAIALSVADAAPNLLARGRAKKKYAPGQEVSLPGITATVERFGLFTIRLRTAQGLLIVVPYRSL